MIKAPVTTATNTSTFVAIATDATNDAFGFSIYMDDNSAFTMAIVEAGTGGVLVGASKTLEFKHYVPPSTTIMWVKASAGTPGLIMIPHKSE